MQVFWEIALLKEETANGKVLRWEYAWHIQGTEKASVHRKESIMKRVLGNEFRARPGMH